MTDIYTEVEEQGISFLLKNENKDLLFSDDGLSYMLITDNFEILNYELGYKWLLSEYGEQWLLMHEDWISTKEGNMWLNTNYGEKWIYTTEQGKLWIQNNIVYHLNTEFADKWFDSENGKIYINNALASNNNIIKDWINKKNKLPDHEQKIKLIKENKKYLLTKEYQEWIKNNEYGQKWHQTEEAIEIHLELLDSLTYEYNKPFEEIAVIEILDSNIGHRWLISDKGKSWLNGIDGLQWVKTYGRRWWVNNKKEGEQWRHTFPGIVWYIEFDPGGFEWINSKEGLIWLSHKENVIWLDTCQGQKWVNSEKCYQWISTDFGMEWLAYENRYQWIITYYGNKWFVENKLKIFMSKYCNEFFSTEYGHEYLDQHGLSFFLTKEGMIWFNSDFGYQFITFDIGSEWIEIHSPKLFNHQFCLEWLNSKNGNKWLSSKYCIKGLHYHVGWLKSKNGSKWLNTQFGINWLDGENGNIWLTLPEGVEWLNSYNNYKLFLSSNEGKKWLSTSSAINWLRTKTAKKWFNSSEGGYIWLDTQYGKTWLNSINGHRYLGSLNGYQWLLTENGAVWLLSNYGEYWRLRTEWGFNWSNTDHGIQFYQSHQELTPTQRTSLFNNKSRTYSIPFESTQNMIKMILDIFHNIPLYKYHEIKFKFVGTNAVDTGGVAREAYSDIIQTYFTTHTFEIFRNTHLLEKYNLSLDFDQTSMTMVSLSHEYYETPEPLVKFGNLCGYICQLCQDGFGFRAGIGFDKYMISLLTDQNNSILDNLNPKIKLFCQDTTLINYEDINLDNYPIISTIVYLITFGGEHTGDFENKINNCLDKIMPNDKHKDIFEKILLESICIICCEKSQKLNKINIPNNPEITKIPFKNIIETLIKIYEFYYQNYHYLFIKEFKKFLSVNKITQWKSYLINDEYSTVQQLYGALQRVILEGEAKKKLMKVIKKMDYDNIRKLLYFWTASSYILKKPYSVIFMKEKDKLPIAHTCSYQMEIPNNDSDVLFKKIEIVLNHNCSFGFG
jgi:HECT-domain (ubiquitin-transferase)